MADLSITPASVVAGTDADYYQGVSGGTVTAGMAVYLDALDNKLKAADANASSKAADVKGIALHGASDGQPLRVQTAGSLTIGATTTVGAAYVLSATPGGIAPIADLLSAMYTTYVGVGGATNTIKLGLFASGQLVP